MKYFSALKRLIGVSLLSALGACAGAREGDLRYNFVIGADRGGPDMLIVVSENADTHIGVLGRMFYPDEVTKNNRANWPQGKWVTSGAPPYDPARERWDYHLTIRPDGSVHFIEIEYRQNYDEAFQPKGKETARIRLALSGQWKWKDGKGTLLFEEKGESTINPVGTWRKQSTREEDHALPGDHEWDLEVTFSADGRFEWQSSRPGDDGKRVDDSLTGRWWIDGAEMTYTFDPPSKAAAGHIPKLFAYWPSKHLGKQTVKIKDGTMVLAHDGGKIWIVLKSKEKVR